MIHNHCLRLYNLFHRQGKLERVVQLAKTGGDPMAGNYDGWNSLHIACL